MRISDWSSDVCSSDLLSIDDYGTGQSTLSYLKHLPAREIKIDKSFILMLESTRSDKAMVRSTIELAHELGFKVVAEGVETAEILDLLRSYGCDDAQGWHIGRPMPAAEYAAFALNGDLKAARYKTHVKPSLNQTTNNPPNP